MVDKPHSDLSDEMLVAFIDGELDGADSEAVRAGAAGDARVAARLDLLRAGDMPFAEAFAGLLAEAPVARLAAMVPTVVPDSGKGRSVVRLDRRWFLAAACLVGGVALDRSLIAVGGGASSDRPQGWRDVVANYMMLYSPETLDGKASGPVPGEREMARLSSLLGVDVSVAKVDLPGIALRRAQLLTYEGAPLAQIAYLDPATGPMAFCFIRRAGRAEAPRTEHRYGMTLAYWSSPTHAFLVVGHGDDARLKAMAEGLQGRLLA